MSIPLTITICATNDCNLRCANCIAGCGRERTDRETTVDFNAVLDWSNQHAPNADFHVSGGEPLLLDDIGDRIELLLSAGKNVSLFTNGSLLPQRPELLELPIVWHVTHHPTGISAEDFLRNIEPIRHQPHIIARLREGHDALNNMEQTGHLYDGFNFRWIVPFGGYFGYRAPKSALAPAQQLLLIGLHGEIFPCSTIRCGDIGNIYDGTFDAEKANAHACRIGKDLRTCQAYQSAVLLHELGAQL